MSSNWDARLQNFLKQGNEKLSAYSKYFHTQQSIVNVCWACQIGGERSEESGSCSGIGEIDCNKNISFPKTFLHCTISSSFHFKKLLVIEDHFIMSSLFLGAA